MRRESRLDPVLSRIRSRPKQRKGCLCVNSTRSKHRRPTELLLSEGCFHGKLPPSPLYAIARKGEEGGGRLHLRFAATERPGQFYRYCGQPFSVEHGTFPPDETAPRHGWIWMITERFFRGESKRFRCCSIGKLATKKESTTTAVGIKRGRLCRVWRAIKISAGVWFPTTDL